MIYPKGIIDHATAKQWNGVVVERIVKTRYRQQHLNGYPSLNTSHEQYARPVIVAQFGLEGWSLTEKIEWFSN